MRGLHIAGVAVGLCIIAAASPAFAVDEPVIKGDQLIYPEGANIPRYETDTEKRWRETHPMIRERAVTPPPTGPIRCVAEYEPMDGILIAWESFTTQLAVMAREITTTGNTDVYVMVDTAGEQGTATTALNNAGVNMSRVKFFVVTTDSVWIRDYGPRYIYQGSCRAVVDHDYNRPTRNNDDAFPSPWSVYKHHAFYEHQIVHGGGNYHLNALYKSYASKLTLNENPGLSEVDIHDIWQNFQNVDTHFFDPYATSIDSTQHIDMWMQVCDDNKVFISDWPANPGSAQDTICEDAVTYMQGQGYTVYRLPARRLFNSTYGTTIHYTYTNMVMCNDIVLLPGYSLAGMAADNPAALATVQAALPGKTIIQVPNLDVIAASAGVMHCIVMHLPKHLGAAGPNGGLAPTAYLKNLRGGDVVPPASPQEIQWISDDDVSVSHVDVLLSTDSGATYDTVLASATADDGSLTWNTPGFYTPYARIKVVARDSLGNTGADESPADFTINGIPVIGDMNCDGQMNLADVEPFVHVLLDDGLYTGCNANFADVNGDGWKDGLDVDPFANLLIP